MLVGIPPIELAADERKKVYSASRRISLGGGGCKSAMGQVWKKASHTP